MSAPALFDTHAHLDDASFDRDRAEVLARARAAGVGEILTVGTDLASSRAALALAAEHPGVYASAGIHPNHAAACREEDFDALARLAAEPGIIAVGETGLDFYHDRTALEVQGAAFRRHLEIAAAVDKPVILHVRQSGEAVLDEVESFVRRRTLRGVFHCFTESAAVLRRALDLGFLIGLSGILTFPKGDNVRALVPQIPDDFLLLDTDCPYLAPVPHRGGRNEPAYAVRIAETLAELRGVSVEDMARITTRNARALFLGAAEKPEGEIAYVIRNALYLALTNDCTNDCVFCARNRAWRVKGHNVRLAREPSAGEVIAALGETGRYDEVVFCGFGEPTMRLEVLCAVADELKRRGRTVRLNTNGQGSLHHGRDIVPDLAGRIDVVSVSLNTPDAESYQRLCRSRFGEAAYGGVCDFIRAAVRRLPRVVCTAVDLPGLDLEAVRRKAESLGAAFRARGRVDVG